MMPAGYDVDEAGVQAGPSSRRDWRDRKHKTDRGVAVVQQRQ